MSTACAAGALAPGLTCAHLQMLSFMHAQYSFFQQGYSLLHQLDPYMKKLAAEVSLAGGVAPRAGEGLRGSFTPLMLPTAGPAGDRLSSGEAGDGAQARCHPAAGEASSPDLPAWGDPKNPLPPPLCISLT